MYQIFYLNVDGIYLLYKGKCKLFKKRFAYFYHYTRDRNSYFSPVTGWLINIPVNCWRATY